MGSIAEKGNIKPENVLMALDFCDIEHFRTIN